ncbi:hypothetical protein BC835DRAFT_1521022 [Cytidiella melzeri]|nr:hypothetical protein BC835DRAFT_1521022 [Cytidiella melzeri]
MHLSPSFVLFAFVVTSTVHMVTVSSIPLGSHQSAYLHSSDVTNNLKGQDTHKALRRSLPTTALEFDSKRLHLPKRDQSASKSNEQGLQQQAHGKASIYNSAEVLQTQASSGLTVPQRMDLREHVVKRMYGRPPHPDFGSMPDAAQYLPSGPAFPSPHSENHGSMGMPVPHHYGMNADPRPPYPSTHETPPGNVPPHASGPSGFYTHQPLHNAPQQPPSSYQAAYYPPHPAFPLPHAPYQAPPWPGPFTASDHAGQSWPGPRPPFNVQDQRLPPVSSYARPYYQAPPGPVTPVTPGTVRPPDSSGRSGPSRSSSQSSGWSSSGWSNSPSIGSSDSQSSGRGNSQNSHGIPSTPPPPYTPSPLGDERSGQS